MKRKPKSTSGKKIISLLMTVIILVSAIAEFTNLTVSAAEYGSGTVNLAQGKTAYASSNQRGDSTVGVREVRFLTDGDTSSYIIMHQDDTDPWVYADLGAEYSVNKIAVYQGADSTYPNSYATRFTVEYTSDLSTAWQTAATVTGAVSGKNTVTFSPVTARYIRIHVQEKYADNASFLELMVYETDYDKAPEEEADTLRILFIGNSLTHYNDVAGKVKALFVANGQEVETETLIQLGKSLTYHASLPETKTTILNGDFDYVVLQDKASGFNGDVLMQGVETIYEWISQTDAQPVLYMPWANKSVLETTQSYFTESYVAAAKAIGAKLAPAGEVWYEFFYTYGYDWYSDNIHANNTGSLVSAATIFYTITGITTPLTFTSTDSAVTANSVDAALMNLIQERSCAYAEAYADLGSIQEPEEGEIPESTDAEESDGEETTAAEAGARPVITVTQAKDPSIQKVSVNGTVTASSETQPASNAVDGNSGTRWESAFSDDEWICLDLGAVYAVTEVTIQWETAAGKVYEIQVSEDGVNWTTVYTVTDGTSGAYMDAVLKESTSARYVKVAGTERTTAYGYSVYELGVYAEVTDTYFVNQNLALGKEAGASSGSPALAVDGSGSTRWESAFQDNQYLYVDLGAEYRIDSVNLIWEAAYGKAYTIETSVDGNNWNVAYTETAGNGETDTITLTDTAARYVMIYGITRATAYGFSLWELEVYGGLTDTGVLPEESTQETAETTTETGEESTPPEVVTPSAVTGVSAVYTDGQIQLTWENNGAEMYKVVRTDGRNGYVNLTYSATAAGWTDTRDLVEAQLYFYRVIGYFKDADGNLIMGEQSEAAGVVAADALPGKVANVQISVSGGNVVLNWDKAENARYYKVSRAAGATGKYYSIKYNIEDTFYTDAALNANMYRYKVVGYYKNVDGTWEYGALSDTIYVTVE